MRIWHCELTDARSIRIRFILSLVWSLPLLAGFWWFDRSGALVAIAAIGFLYMSVVGVVLDQWRLRHRDAPEEKERRLRLFALLPVLAGTPAAVFWFT